MGNDLPDYQLGVETGALKASSLQNGADAAKSAAPGVGDVYVATDTTITYFCFAAGAWTNISALYLLLAGGTLSGALAMGTNKITGLAAPAADADAARKVDVDTVDAKLDDVSVAQPVRVLDTIYQNTTKIRLVVVVCTFDGGLTEEVTARIGAASPPVTDVDYLTFTSGHGGDTVSNLVMLVPPSYYYRAIKTLGTAALTKWTEYDLF